MATAGWYCLVQPMVPPSFPFPPGTPRYRRVLSGNLLKNFALVSKFLSHIPSEHRTPVNIQGIGTGLQRALNHYRIVADKYPDYVFALSRLAGDEHLKVICVVRDARDVVNSTVNAFAIWGKWWPDEYKYPAAIASNWVRAAKLILEFSSKCLVLRYEDLVSDRDQIRQQLGQFLDVDPTGFRFHFIHANSIGKHKGSLTPEEINAVLEIAWGHHGKTRLPVLSLTGDFAVKNLPLASGKADQDIRQLLSKH